MQKSASEATIERLHYCPEWRQQAREFIQKNMDRVTNHFLQRMLDRIDNDNVGTDDEIIQFVSLNFCHAMYYWKIYAGLDSFLVVGDKMTFVMGNQMSFVTMYKTDRVKCQRAIHFHKKKLMKENYQADLINAWSVPNPWGVLYFRENLDVWKERMRKNLAWKPAELKLWSEDIKERTQHFDI